MPCFFFVVFIEARNKSTPAGYFFKCCSNQNGVSNMKFCLNINLLKRQVKNKGVFNVFLTVD